MARFIQQLLVTLADSSDAQLRQQIQFLKAENELLRSRLLGDRIRTVDIHVGKVTL